MLIAPEDAFINRTEQHSAAFLAFAQGSGGQFFLGDVLGENDYHVFVLKSGQVDRAFDVQVKPGRAVEGGLHLDDAAPADVVDILTQGFGGQVEIDLGQGHGQQLFAAVIKAMQAAVIDVDQIPGFRIHQKMLWTALSTVYWVNRS